MRGVVLIALALLLISRCDQAAALAFLSRALEVLGWQRGIHHLPMQDRQPVDISSHEARSLYKEEAVGRWQSWYDRGQLAPLELRGLNLDDVGEVQKHTQSFFEVLEGAAHLGIEAQRKLAIMQAWKVFPEDSVRGAFGWLRSPSFAERLAVIQRKYEERTKPSTKRLRSGKATAIRDKAPSPAQFRSSKPSQVRTLLSIAIEAINVKILQLARAELAAAKQARAAAVKAESDGALEAKWRAALEAKREAALEAEREAALEAKRKAAFETKRKAAFEAERDAAREGTPSVQKKMRWTSFPWTWGENR